MDKQEQKLNYDLTKGSIGKSLVLFSLPMILGNLLQQLYNIADTLIVGRTIGAKALAAVGSSYALMVLLTSIILGLCMGSSVVFSQLYGAGKQEEMKTSVWNAFVFIMLLAVLIQITAYLLLKPMISWLHIPPEAAVATEEYLQVIFAGIILTGIYNFGASLLRSIGNTVTALVILAFCSVINIILDLVFILQFHMGVRGAAVATVISQGISAVCIVWYCQKKARDICPKRQNMHYNRPLLQLVIENSILTALQQSIMNFGILMVQGLVNSFGYAASAAFAVVVKIDGFAYMPAQDFGNAFATYVAQNYGAKKNDRISQGIRTAISISAIFCVLASAVVNFFARPLMLLFLQKEEVESIVIGMQYLHIEGACYLGIGILFLLYALYRGMGKAGISIVLTVLSLGTRVVLAYVLSAIPAVGMTGIWWAVPIGWGIADCYGIWYYLRKKRL